MDKYEGINGTIGITYVSVPPAKHKHDRKGTATVTSTQSDPYTYSYCSICYKTTHLPKKPKTGEKE